MVYMKEALKEARKAYANGEVPVGAVVVKDGAVIGRGYNRKEEKGQAVSHAEIEAIMSASKNLGTWRLSNCELYVTLEPCAMCSGAIINSRIEKVYFGAYDEKAGCMGSKINLAMCGLLHEPKVSGGHFESECKELLRTFFEGKR